MQPPSAPSAELAGAPRARGARMFGHRNAAWISTASTVVVVAIVAVVLATAPGMDKVQESFFNPEDLRASARTVVPAFLTNIRIMLIAEALVLVFALVVALLRGLPGAVFFPLRLIAVGYVDFFRGVPLIMVLYVLSFALPALELEVLSTQTPFTYGVMALVLVYSAYVAEVYRAGIESVHESQVAAARSLGLSGWQAMRFVVLPQAVRRVIPPLLNDFIGLQKDTALVTVIGTVEVLRSAQDYTATTFNFSSYVIAALLFVALTIPLARFTDYLVERDRRRMRASGA